MVKIAPDLADDDLVDIAKLVKKLKLAGVIATNTTISREGLVSSVEEVSAMGLGGLSGPVLKKRSLEVLQILAKNLDSSHTIISVGGVETKADVAERIKAGATLVQGYTGFIYFGPLWARKINS